MQDSMMMAEVGGMLKVSGSRINAVGAAETRKHADDDAEHDAQDHHHDVEGLQGYGKTLKKIGDFFHCGKSCNPELMTTSKD
jgi:hypothetical protein